MRSHQRRKRNDLMVRGAIGALLLGALFFATQRAPWFDGVFIDSAAASSFVRGGIDLVASDIRIGVMRKRDVVAENARLRDENTALAIRAALYDEVVAERNRLYERFGREATNAGVLARVVVSPSRSPYDTFIIDAGSLEGVSVGDAVWFDTTTYIGTIDVVGDRSARVRLFSSPEEERFVSVGTSTALVAAVGRGGGSFELAVPKEIPVAIGDTLTLPTEGRGMLGIVRDVVARDADSFQTVYAASPINLFETREVLVRPASPNYHEMSL